MNILQEKKWKNSDTYKRLSDEIGKSLIAISHEKYNFSVSPFLITNKQYCDFLCSIPILNNEKGIYRWVNTYLFNGRIKKSGEPYYIEIDGKVLSYNFYTKNLYYVVPNFENHPIVAINWYGAELFARALDFRLPDISEWEIAASGFSNSYLYPWGNEVPTPELANYGEIVGKTTPVGQYPPNAIGLYDMAGNVREWCNDSLTDCHKYIKGGGWNKPVYELKIKKSKETWIMHSGTSIGFRIFKDG